MTKVSLKGRDWWRICLREGSIYLDFAAYFLGQQSWLTDSDSMGPMGLRASVGEGALNCNGMLQTKSYTLSH